MAKQTINIGSAPNDGQGSTLRAGGDLINDNFNEIYTAFGDGSNLSSGFITGKQEGTNFTSSMLIGHGTTGTLSSAENNIGVGTTTLSSITSGDGNTAVGVGSLTTLTAGIGNTTVGHQAGKVATGNYNTNVGKDSGLAVSSGGYNTFVGFEAGKTITTGSGNVILGNAAGDNAADTRTLKVAGWDGSTTTTWFEGDSDGKVILSADPTAAMGIATKQYVDAQVGSENEISEMNDVTLTSISSGDILQWNGAAFVNIALGTIGTMASQNANAVNITGGSITMGSLSNTSTLLVKNSSGTTLKTIIGTTS